MKTVDFSETISASDLKVSRSRHLIIIIIIIIIIIFALEPVFLYRGLGFLTSLPRRRPLHSEQFSGSAESIPSFSLSFFITSSHDFLGLPDLFCATTFSLRTSEIQPVLRSTCPNHLILLVRSTTSKSWMPSFVRRESELTSSFALTLQIQRIMAWSLVITPETVQCIRLHGPSLCCMKHHAPHT